MPADPPDHPDAPAAAALLHRARTAAVRDARVRAAAARDVAGEEEPDERLRAAVRRLAAAAVAPIERDLRLGAARRLAEMQAVAAAEALLDDPQPVTGRLDGMAPAVRDALAAELVDLARVAALAARLPAGPAIADRPSLLVRLAECPEPEVAARAAELLALVGLSTGPEPAGADAAPPLPRAVWTDLVWWCAAALRDRLGDERRADHALVEAAEELIARTDPVPTVAGAATRLAAAIGARPDELPGLLMETLGDRRPELFAAVLAHATGLDPLAVRAMLADPAGDRLWLLLRAQDVDRTTLARIGVALAAADPARDLDRFADALDAAMLVDPEAAAAFFAPLALPPAYRAARAALKAPR